MSTSAERIRLVKYSILQTTLAPSILCDIFVFVYFFRHWRKEIINAPHYHVTLCLLIVSFIQKTTDIIFHLYYLRWGIVISPTYSFCVTWNWLNYSLYCVNLDLVTWCCIERHLFVFHSHLMKKKLALIVFHYLPLTVCLIYTPLFYLHFVFFPDQCTNSWNYSLLYCGGPCYLYSDPLLGTFDWLFHCGTPILIIFFANLLLFQRILWQKLRRQRRVRWKRHRRLILQLAFISILFLIFASPAVIVGCIQLLWLPTFLYDVQNDYFYYVGCFINQLLPFVIVSSLPKLNQEVKRKFAHLRRRLCGRLRVQPVVTLTMADINYGTAAMAFPRVAQ
ncbi:unnamed protein product [Adineta ricciae]|uniref:G-protein coupled receptors family 1 profile domain-containing protein n=1 Tax=Adineta ricciae TaxID=249248 RepID=A0A813U6X2_ADIRI|nr:unnamed protein product [Adineta ricciae]